MTDSSPRSLLALGARLELDGIGVRLDELIEKPDPDLITATAKQSRDVADMLDEGNRAQLRSV